MCTPFLTQRSRSANYPQRIEWLQEISNPFDPKRQSPPAGHCRAYEEARKPPMLWPNRTNCSRPICFLHSSTDWTNCLSASRALLLNCGLELRPKPAESILGDWRTLHVAYNEYLANQMHTQVSIWQKYQDWGTTSLHQKQIHGGEQEAVF